MYGAKDIPYELQEVNKNTTHYILLTSLRSYVQYSVQVLGFTRMGDGVLSDPAYAQTAADGKH